MPRPVTSRTATRRREAPVTRAFLFSDPAATRPSSRRTATRPLSVSSASTARSCAERSRATGAEVKTEGDSFYVVFDGASAALECAIAILRAADAHNASDAEHPLRVGVGLHAGEVVPHDRQYVGSAVNIGARLAAKAEAGELLVSDTMRGLVRTSSSYEMQDRGPMRLKGVAERVRAWSVVWRETTIKPVPASPPPPAPVLPPSTPARIPAPAGQLLCPTVLGRDAELAQIAEGLARAGSGAGETVIVGGEAGVGKTAFVRRAQELAAERRFRLLTGLTHEASAGLPYFPFVSAVRSGFRGLEHERLGRVLQQVAPALAQLFPELGHQAAQAAPPSGIERHRLTVSFQDLLRAFAHETPVLLVVEDLHWADEASLELLHELARELRDARVLLLATYRSDELHRRHPFLRTLAALQRERLVTTIQLRRLSVDEIGEAIRLILGHQDPVSTEFRDAIYARCEGNPFFAEELIKALAESGEIFRREDTRRWTRGGKAVEELAIPDSIVEAVRARVERLSVEAKITLAAAAVIGQRFPFPVLVAVRGTGEAEVEAHLREFIELQLATEHRGEEDAYAFRHALTREVVYDDLLVSERKRLHRVVADAVGARPAAEPALLAHHLVAAGESQAAVPHLLAAAERASRADAPREAVAHYEKVIGIGVPDERRAETFERLSLAYRLFDVVRATTAMEAALALYRAAGDPRDVSRALRWLSLCWTNRGDGERARALAHEAIDVLREVGECAELGQALARLAGMRMLDGADEEAVTLADQAIAVGERSGDTWTLAAATVTKGSALGHLSPAKGEALLIRGRDLAIANRLPETALTAYNNLYVVMSAAGRPVEERLALIEEGIAYGRRHGADRLANLPYFLANIEFGRGDWDAALERTRRYKEFDPREYTGWEGTVTMGRRGPREALPIILRQSEAAMRAREGQAVVPAAASAALVCALVDDEAGARSWLDRLRARLATDEAARSFLGWGPVAAPLLLLALRYGEEDEWFPAVQESSERRTDALLPARREIISAARALGAGDAAAAARSLIQAREPIARVGYEAWWAWHALLFALEARRRGLRVGAEWHPIFDRIRGIAQRAKAAWWLQELDVLAGSQPS